MQLTTLGAISDNFRYVSCNFRYDRATLDTSIAIYCG
nr:MAG TPA: hypothetical protein [Caudoviricetes sp.]